MPDSRDLKITITAINNAKKAMDEVKRQLEDVSKGMKDAKVASEGNTASVFKGVAAYDLLRMSIRAAVDLFKASMAESLDSARIMAQVKTNVQNAGFAFDELAPKIKAVGEAAVQLGFDDDIAAESLSKFLVVTRDMEQAQSLLGLSYDLSRAKNIDLATAVKTVTMITQGATKELKLQGIEIDENATVAQNLAKVFDNVKDSATNFANENAGQIATLTEEWHNLQQQIGDELAPEMSEMFKLVMENKPTILALADGFIFLGKAIGFVIKGAVGAAKIFATGISATAEAGTGYLASMAGGLNYLGIVSDETVKKAENWNMKWSETTKAAADDALALYDTVPKLTKTMGDYSKGLGGVKDAAKKGAAALSELKEAMQNAGDEYTDFVDDAKSSLADLEDSHRDRMRNIRDSIQDTLASLKQLSKTYKHDLSDALNTFNDSAKSNSKELAESIVGNQDAIAALKAEIAGGVSNTRKKEIDSELAQRQAVETQNAALIASLAVQIAEVKKYNSMSELEQAIYNYNQKQALAQQEYSENVGRIKSEYKEKKAALEQELLDLKEQKKKEKDSYKEKYNFIKTLQDQALSVHIEAAKKGIAVTKAQVETEIKYYQALAEAVKAARSGGTSAFGNIKSSVASVKVPAFAEGGIVTRPTLALIGEAGPEAVVPLKKGGRTGGDIYLTIKGNSFMGKEEAAEEIGDMIINKLKYSNQL